MDQIIKSHENNTKILKILDCVINRNKEIYGKYGFVEYYYNC